MKTKVIKCSKCQEEMLLVNDPNWGESTTNECHYVTGKCEDCCNCGGHS